MTDQLHRFTASELLGHYRRRDLSPVEVTEAVLRRIEQLNPAFNAFVLLDADAALAAARASEVRWQRNAPLGPLDGVPLSIKDLLLTRGWPTRRGSLTVSAEGSWHDDAPAVARVRESGAVLLGKTTTTEFGLTGRSESPLSGVTHNPWHTAHGTGGSSAGAVAAVAAGFGPLAIATDGGGSIRVPSAFAGVVGFKPTFGRVPTWPASVVGVPPHVGPIARSVEDAALLLTVIAGADDRDPFRLPAEHRDYRQGLARAWDEVRIGVSTLGWPEIEPEIAQAFERATQVFAELGARVEAADPEIPASAADVRRTLFAARAAHTVKALRPEQRRLLDPGVEQAARDGERLSALDYLAAEHARVALAESLAGYHRRHDLLLTPTTAWSAPALAVAKPREPSPFAFPFSLTRQPAISIPAGLTRAGLPIGVQIVGRHFEDALVLSAAHAFERRAPFPTLPEPPAPA
jgi:aspartyl-tRNA(Asn)/glutamyl-tRNA(Gln) amidotransferase subunit A